LQQHPAQLFAVPRLGDVAIDVPAVDRLDQHIHVGVGGHDDRHRQRRQRLGFFEKLQAGQLGHPLIRHDHRHPLARQDLEPFLRRLRGQDAKAFAKVEAKGVQVVGLVIDHQHRQRLDLGAHFFGPRHRAEPSSDAPSGKGLGMRRKLQTTGDEHVARRTKQDVVFQVKV
jgi:hypothetical protein